MRHARNPSDIHTAEHPMTILALIVFVTIIMALLVYVIPSPYNKVNPSTDSRAACQPVCPRPTIAGVCPVAKIPWRVPYPCVSSY